MENNWQDADGATKLPKWQKTRSVPIPEPVVNALTGLQELFPATGFVLPNQRTVGTPMTAAGIRHEFNRLLRDIGISDIDREARCIVFHSLRHGFVSLCQREGIPEHVLKAMSGQSSDKVVARYYSHVTESFCCRFYRSSFSFSASTFDGRRWPR